MARWTDGAGASRAGAQPASDHAEIYRQLAQQQARHKAQQTKLPADLSVSRKDYSGTGTPGQYIGQAWVLEGYKQLLGGRVFLKDQQWTFYDTNHKELAGIGNNECASLVQAFGVPSTKLWRRGPRVKDAAEITPGTVIATMGDGVYYSDYSGRSHVGIFHSKTDEGITLIDQWNGANVGMRTKRYDVEPAFTDYVNPEKAKD